MCYILQVVRIDASAHIALVVNVPTCARQVAIKNVKRKAVSFANFNTVALNVEDAITAIVNRAAPFPATRRRYNFYFLRKSSKYR